MVSEITSRGLIIAPGRCTSDLLDELISHLDWPVLVQPSVRLLLQEVEVTSPIFLLFWLEQAHEITQTLQLIARLRDRGPRPYRIAVAHQLNAEIEPTIRAAGIHSFFRTSGNITTLVRDALLPLLFGQRQSAATKHAVVVTGKPLARAPTSVRPSPAEIHPP
ncbi:MAG TPA: hypothetical protein VHE81_14590 [Lacipirellulaceae bacterium]|nr:hypothetical protein [Lacipirellulaceae bacterium]